MLFCSSGATVMVTLQVTMHVNHFGHYTISMNNDNLILNYSSKYYAKGYIASVALAIHGKAYYILQPML